MSMNICKSVVLVAFLGVASLLWAAESNKISLEEASKFIRHTTKGNILSTGTSNFNGVRAHRFKVLTPSGRVKVFQVPVQRDKNTNSMNYIHNGKYYSNDHHDQNSTHQGDRNHGSSNHTNSHQSYQHYNNNNHNNHNTSTPSTSNRTTKH